MLWAPEPNLDLLLASFGNPAESLRHWKKFELEQLKEKRPDSLASICGHIRKNLGVAQEARYFRNMATVVFLRNADRIGKALPVIKELSFLGRIYPLKGFDILNRFQDLSARSIGDIDLFVEYNKLKEIVDYLTSKGFSPAHGVKVEELFDHIVPKRGSWSMVKDGVDLDLHWKIFDYISLQANQELVLKNIQAGSCGRYDLPALKIELVLLHSLFHDCYQSNGVYQGLHDTIAFENYFDKHLISKIAGEIGLDLHLEAFNLIVKKTIGKELFASTKRKRQSPYENLELMPPIREVKEKSPLWLNRRGVYSELKRSSGSRMRWKWLYIMWDKAFRSAKVESFILKFLTSFTPTETLSSFIDTRDGITDHNVFGIGWSWKNPGQTGRFCEGPDARLVLNVKEGLHNGRLIIDQHLWNWSTVGNVDFFCSGKFLFSINHSKNEYDFQLPESMRTRKFVEFSFRPRNFYRSRDLGEGTHWYRLSVPLVYLGLISDTRSN